jgi:hypothetical protein
MVHFLATMGYRRRVFNHYRAPLRYLRANPRSFLHSPGVAVDEGDKDRELGAGDRKNCREHQPRVARERDVK